MATTTRTFVLPLVFLVATSVASSALAAADGAGAKALESRLYAPCCYGGTLDIHDSELARDLRKEIEARVDHGESADAVQADFVARYGARVVAARSADTIRALSLAAIALAVVGALALGWTLRRWTRRSDEAPAAKAPPRRDDAGYDARVDAELAELDG